MKLTRNIHGSDVGHRVADGSGLEKVTILSDEMEREKTSVRATTGSHTRRVEVRAGLEHLCAGQLVQKACTRHARSRDLANQSTNSAM
jgi:hypothetical protein